MTDYEILDLPPGSTDDVVKRQYRKLVKTCHPDKFPNDPLASERFNEITQAYDRLLNRTSDVSTPDLPHVTYATSLANNFIGCWFIGHRSESVRIEKGFSEADTFEQIFQDGTGYTFSFQFVCPEGFRVEGYDLYTKMTVSKRQVNKGTIFKIPNYPDIAPANVLIPKEAHHGQEVYLEAGGLLKHDGTYGDLYITVEYVSISDHLHKVIGVLKNAALWVFVVWLLVILFT